MNKYDITAKIEAFAPLETQERWDASGWIVDTGNKEVNRIMFALTITDDIYYQAVNRHCDMIISHHPLFYVPMKYKNINMYCAHTNLDKADGGTTDTLIKALQFQGKKLNDYVRVVEFENEISIELLKIKLLHLSPRLRYVNNHEIRTIKKVCFCAGSGSEFIKETDCDAFVTGDLKFHTAIETDKVIFDIGHFESEIMVVKVLKEIAQVDEKGILADEKSPFM